MKLAEKIPYLVKRNGMTQAELARTIGIHSSRVSDWVTGKGSPSIQKALRMARALGVTLDYLADDEQDEPPATSLDEWEAKALEIIRTIGPKKAWHRLVDPMPLEGSGDSGGEVEPLRRRPPA